MTQSSCNIISLNNKAISLVQQGEGKSAVKIFLQALGMLKSELCGKNSQSSCSTTGEAAACGNNASSCSSSANAASSPFFRVLIAQDQQHLPEHQQQQHVFTRFDRLLALNPNVDPCAPHQRDGTTACLLYNMALTEERLSLRHNAANTNGDNVEQHGKLQKMMLKKAANIYGMAYSAAQHWKRWTTDHPGYDILCLAILNNLVGIHQQLPTNNNHCSKVRELVSCFRSAFLVSNKKHQEINGEEHALFRANLERYQDDGAIQADHQDATTAANGAAATTQVQQQPQAIVNGAA